MAGGMEMKKNKYVEDWALYRENVERHFRFDRRTLAIVFTFGVLVPMAIYKGTVSEFHKHDMDHGKVPSKFM